MPPTLRKRPAPAAEPATAPSTAKKARPAAIKEVVAKKAAAAAPKAKPAAAVGASGTGTASSITVGGIVDLDDFGGTVSTHDGKAVSLKSLVQESKAGVILFTYPKASTPGCKSLFT